VEDEMLKNANSPETSLNASFDVKSKEQRYLSGMQEIMSLCFM